MIKAPAQSYWGTIVVTVNGDRWIAVSSLRDAGPNDPVYTLNPETGSIASSVMA